MPINRGHNTHKKREKIYKGIILRVQKKERRKNPKPKPFFLLHWRLPSPSQQKATAHFLFSTLWPKHRRGPPLLTFSHTLSPFHALSRSSPVNQLYPENPHLHCHLPKPTSLHISLPSILFPGSSFSSPHTIVPPLSPANHLFKTKPESLTLRPTSSLAVLGLPHRRSKEKERRRETKLTVASVWLTDNHRRKRG